MLDQKKRICSVHDLKLREVLISLTAVPLRTSHNCIPVAHFLGTCFIKGEVECKFFSLLYVGV